MRLAIVLLAANSSFGKWTATEENTFYIGNDIGITHRASSLDCQLDCANLRGCELYVWEPRDGGTCLLKSHKGVKAPYLGAEAAAMLQRPSPPYIVPSGELNTPIEYDMFGDSPLPRVPFHYVNSAQWNLEFPFALYNATFNASERVFDQEYNLSPESEIISPYASVESVAECAYITWTQKLQFFTYLSTPKLCVPHKFKRRKNGILMRHTMAGKNATMAYNSNLPLGFLSNSFKAESNEDCLKLCTAGVNGTCVGLTFVNNTCSTFAPRPAPSDVFAGWVRHSIAHIEDVMIRIAYMPGFALQGYKEREGPKKDSIYACGEWVEITQHILFHYDFSTKACSYFEPVEAPNKTIQLHYSSNELVQINGDLNEATMMSKVVVNDAKACDRLCIPEKDNCFATVFDAVSKSCVLHTPSMTKGRTLAWLAPRKLIDNLKDVTEAHFYGTAHQDDHELFMAQSVFHHMNSTKAKVVFIYTTAGDAGETNGWWEARELGTLAASKAWVESFGLFNSRVRTETIFLENHSIHKVTIGNAVHYFLRLTEDAVTGYLLGEAKVASPVDRPSESYHTYVEFRNVITAIMKRESNRMPVVTVATHEYEGFAPEDVGVDHELHEATGAMFEEIATKTPEFKNCVSRSFYCGYQRWLYPQNMDEVPRRLQRFAWGQVSTAIYDIHKHFYPVWLDHSQHLGRQYLSRTENVQGSCSIDF
ncbi:hypothetical protein THRCLA_05974 [Thraustotheca clavata]|uniref:Secreted protein n=1 Tax=Thraustotheca clavata TaxID=74557 RepID=A0A1V9ZQU5_9STRA|nr:hypothetical protein THRCLA_05974 [Thraustotheca clavata]